MVFSELVFVYGFFPLVMLLYFAVRGIRAKNVVLLMFSLLFYAWGEPAFVLLLVLMTLADWLLVMGIERARAAQSPRFSAKFWLIAVCVVNLGLLGVFKYGTFLLTNTKSLFGFPSAVPSIMLPIGISFYTFQLLSYAVDVYRGEVRAQRNFASLLLFCSLFHQSIAGPIVRYAHIQNELTDRQIVLSDVSRGVGRFAVGLAKKAVLANSCWKIFEKMTGEDGLAAALSPAESAAALAGQPAAMLWLGMLAFMLYIYLDFSAYSDMAVGMGLMTGFHYRENFDYPYASRSVSEFWRRWHISLGSFFRDYVYIPLGGSRKGKGRTMLNLLIVWGLTGFWHGASWNFLLWGLYFFLFLAVEKLFLGDWLQKIPRVFSHIYLLAAVFFGWILFQFRDTAVIWTIVKGMFGANGNPFSSFETSVAWQNNIFLLITAIIAVTPLARNLGAYMQTRAENGRLIKTHTAAQTALPVLLMLLATFALVGNSYHPFLYFQF
ncbi:MAG: MBOAT family protein [Oscillospiraceae bacterium]|nr:MBOAT family protein [Oscillospiraceae bacterium]